MHDYQIYYVGTEAEVAHHAAPTAGLLNLRIATPEEVQRFAQAGDLAIFFSEHFHRFRNAWFQLHQRQCVTLYALDGILEWRNAWETGQQEPACPWTMRPVLCDKVACIGPSQARLLDAWGNSGKTEVVGLPRLDEWVARYNGLSSTVETDGPFRILVATAKWPGYTPAQLDQIRQSLIDLLSFSLRQTELNGQPVQWIWRLTGGLAEELGVANTLTSTTGPELESLLDEADAVITTPSTLMLESMLKRRPTAILDYTNSPVLVPAAWHITARAHMEPVIRELQSPSRPRTSHQEQLLADALQIEQPASQRMADLCTGMMRHAHDCRTIGRPLKWQTGILEPLKSCRPASPAIHAGQAQAGTTASASPKFEALASENQRQLDILQQRVALLESELERAADGFQKIANHPILGPLLKVRQTAIRFGNQIGQVLSRESETGNSAMEPVRREPDANPPCDRPGSS